MYSKLIKILILIERLRNCIFLLGTIMGDCVLSLKVLKWLTIKMKCSALILGLAARVTPLYKIKHDNVIYNYQHIY